MEGTVRIMSHFSYGIRRLCFYKSDNSRFAHISSLKSLLKNAPFPLASPGTERAGFILNSKGFRTPEYQLNKSLDTTRILAIGDSFTFSSSVPFPYHFTVLLEEKLKAWFEEDVEMINLGLACVGPRYEKRLLELEGVQLNPDLVIWTFFVGNDFTDEIPSKDAELTTKYHILLKLSYLSRLVRNGAILYSSLSTSRLQKIDKTRDGPSGTYIGNPNNYDSNKPSIEKNKFLEIQAKRMSIYSKESFPWHHWQDIQNTFIEVRNTCRHFRVPLFVVIIPDENQVNSSLLEEVVKQFDKSVHDFQMDYPQKLLTDFFEKNEIDYLDLLGAFTKLGEEKRLYKLQDTHWNIEGNKLAAAQIFKCLVDKKASLLSELK